jgi:NADH-quinone oxidoreductase subunit I
MCVEACPFDALFWSPQYDYAATAVSSLLHSRERLGEWLKTVVEPPALEEVEIEQPPVEASA